MNHKIIVLINCIFLIAFASAAVYFIKIQDNKIESSLESQELFIDKTKKFIDETEVKLNNQTAIIYKALNESFPVIIPDESAKLVTSFISDLNELRENLDFDSAYELETKFSKYLSVTPPWIQEEQTEDLLNIKYELEYLSILSFYEKDKSNIAETITLLSDLLDSNIKYHDDNLYLLVEKSFNELNQKYLLQVEDEYEKEIIKVINDTYKILKRDTSDVGNEELSDLLNTLSIYSDDDRVKSKLEDLDVFVTKKETNEISKSFKKNYEIVIKNYKDQKIWDQNLYDELHDEALSLYERNPQEYYEEYLEVIEIEVLYRLTSKANSLKKQVKDIKDNYNKNIEVTLSLIKTQLSNLQYEVTTIQKVDKSKLTEIVKEINSIISEIEMNVSKEASAYNNKLLKKYNKWILETIKKANSNNDYSNSNKKIFPSPEEEKQYINSKIAILKKLDEVDLSYAYIPINSLYNSIYSDVWNSIDKQIQLDYAIQSINIEKRGLLDFE